MMTFDSASAAARALARCHSCGRVEPVETGHCPRCHAPLHLRKPGSLQRTMALTIGAAILYFPANLLPVLRVESTLNGTQTEHDYQWRRAVLAGGGLPRCSHYFHRQRNDSGP